MSQINTNAILDASGGTTATVNGFTPTVSNMAGRNRIINGAMMIDQRNAGASVTGNHDVYTLDRWKCNASQSSKYTVQQITDAPSGFIRSLKVTSSSAYTVGAAEIFGIRQVLEGYSMEDWNWPNAGGKTVTLSFWVKSSLTGTFGGAVFSSSDNYIFSYSISSANTWEYKTITIPAPTSGTWPTGNSGSASIFWSLGSGVDRQQTAGAWYYSNARRSVTSEVQIVANNAATWQITGVQLEVGSAATPFEHRQYGQELALCQRYFEAYTQATTPHDRLAAGCGWSEAISKSFYVQKRAVPSITWSNLEIRNGSNGAVAINFILGTTNDLIAYGVSSVGGVGSFRYLNGTGYLWVNSEL